MLNKIIRTALAAGALAGVFLFVLHVAKTIPMILHAEIYETGGDTSNNPKYPANTDAGADQAAGKGAWAPAAGFERYGYSLLSDLLTAFGFAFLLTGAMALGGRQINGRQGLVWGLCGFAAFSAAPAFGLAPELPGMPAADLQARQIWWLVTAILTAAGLALIFFSQRALFKGLALAMILLPQLVGAPTHSLPPGRVPAQLAAEFAVTALMISALFWLLLGGLCGHFFNRFRSS